MSQLSRAGFLRRLVALFYDWLLLAALLMVAGGIAIGWVKGLEALGLLSLQGYADVSSYLVSSRYYIWYLIAVIMGFYVGFWVKAGQTLGMKAWRLRVQNIDGRPLSIAQAVVRCSSAVLGLGNLLVLIAADKRALQDRIADCEVVVLPKSATTE